MKRYQVRDVFSKHIFSAFLLLYVSMTILVAQSNAPIIFQFIAWSPDSNQIAAGGYVRDCESDSVDRQNVIIIDAQTLETIRTLDGFECHITDIAWNSDGSRLSVTSVDFEGVKIWDVQTGQLITRLQTGSQGMTAVEWNPLDDSEIAVAYVGNSTAIMNSETGEITHFFLAGGKRLDWNSSGTFIAIGGADGVDENVIAIVDKTENLIIRTFASNAGYITSIDWKPNSTLIANGSADQTVLVWDANNGQILHTLLGHTALVRDIAWRPNSSRQLASAGFDGTIRIWDTISGQQIEQFLSVGRVFDIDWSPNGSKLAYTDETGIVKIVVPSTYPDLLPSPTPTATLTPVPPTVTASVVDDLVVEGTQPVVITDAGYNGISVADVTVTITDNDV